MDPCTCDDEFCTNCGDILPRAVPIGRPVLCDDCDDNDCDEPCWCGEPHPYYDYDQIAEECDGSGVVSCLCGGDQCVCHHHGDAPCAGCVFCDNADEDYVEDDCDGTDNDCDEDRPW